MMIRLTIMSLFMYSIVVRPQTKKEKQKLINETNTA